MKTNLDTAVERFEGVLLNILESGDVVLLEREEYKSKT